MKKLVANRVPPGDRWVMIDDEADNASINTKSGSPYLNKKGHDKEYDPEHNKSSSKMLKYFFITICLT